MSTPPPLLDVAPFDRTPVLSRGERAALAALGWQLRRRRGHDAARPEWGAIGRLLAPLDAARLALRNRRDTPLHRRSSKDAVDWCCAGARRRAPPTGGGPRRNGCGWSVRTAPLSAGPGRAGWTRPYGPMLPPTAISSAASMRFIVSAASTALPSPGAYSAARPWNSPRSAS